MATSLKTLLKKGKLTGDEVGRLMIQDLIAAYKNRLEGKEGKGFLTDAEMTALVNGLSERQDIKRYNEFRFVHEYLVKSVGYFSMYKETAEICFWRIYHILMELKQAEEENSRIKWQPRIMTQKQYDELKQADFERKMQVGYSVEELIIHAVGYYFNLYKKGKKTPFNKYFTAAKKQPITNPRIKANYWAEGEFGLPDNGYYVLPDGRTSRDLTPEEWQKEEEKHNPWKKILNAQQEMVDKGIELTVADIMQRREAHRELGKHKSPIRWVEDLTAPDDATMFDVLEYLDGFYFSMETDSEETIFEFMADFSDLYKALWGKLTAMKGLSFLKDIPREQYFDMELISVKELYENDILDIRDVVDSFNPDGCGGGVAVLQPHVCYPKSHIDERATTKSRSHIGENTTWQRLYWKNLRIHSLLS